MSDAASAPGRFNPPDYRGASDRRENGEFIAIDTALAGLSEGDQCLN